MYIVLLALFPNLELFYPVDLIKINKTLQYSEHLPNSCARELNLANECIKNATNVFIPKNTVLFGAEFFSEVQVLDYHKTIVNSQCLKHTSCLNVVFIRQLYEKLTPVVETIQETTSDCIKKMDLTTKTDLTKCNKSRKWDHPEILEMCWERVINKQFQCSQENRESLIQAVKIDYEVDEHLLQRVRLLPDDYNSGFSDNHILIVFMLVIWFWL